MVMYIATLLAMLLIGCLVGWRLTWWWMNRQWKRYPQQFHTLIDAVTQYRKDKSEGKVS